MLNCRKNSLKEFASTPFRNHFFQAKRARILILSAILALTYCAPKVKAPIEPRIPLENPMSFLNAPKDPVFEQTYAIYEKGDYRKAREKFQKIVHQDPKHFPSFLAIGYTYLAEGNLDFAEKEVLHALELKPDYLQAHFAMGHILEVRQSYDQALAEFQMIARTHPDYPGLQQNLSLVKLKATEMHLNEAHKVAQSDPDRAIRELKVVEQLAPEVPQVAEEIAGIYLQQQNCKDAIPYLQTATGLSPDDIQIKRKLGGCLLQEQDYDAALVIYQELSSREPGNQELVAKIHDIQEQIAIRKLPEEFQTISSAPQISRAQFAALLMIQLDVLDRFTAQDSKIIVDTFGHWAQSYIQKTVNLGIIDLFPNRTFQPELPITRLELAKAASRILEIIKPNQDIQPATSETSIPDISSDNVYYSMISRALSAGLISLDGDGRFHPSRAVSGPEAISMVNRVKNMAGRS
jgi:tetratricopeptide (TPR) repeat protein